jgi:PAS domain S-box-containing protein
MASRSQANEGGNNRGRVAVTDAHTIGETTPPAQTGRNDGNGASAPAVTPGPVGQINNFSSELIEALPCALYTTDASGRITFYNEAAAAIWGRRPELGEEWCGSWKIYASDGTQVPLDQCPMAVAVKERRAVRGIEAIVERPDGTRVSLIPYPTPMYNASGEMIGAVNVLVDISEHKRVEETLELLVGEIKHRIKNTLSTVLAIAAQTFRQAPSQEYDIFTARLVALASAHDLMTQKNWQSVRVVDIVARAKAPFEQPVAPRFSTSGPEALLASSEAQMLAMALHELSTNAAKYGALSKASGRVALSWAFVGESAARRRLKFDWRESGGPTVEPPERKGFGTTLIEHMLDGNSGSARLQYLPGGLVCTFELAV